MGAAERTQPAIGLEKRTVAVVNQWRITYANFSNTITCSCVAAVVRSGSVKVALVGLHYPHSCPFSKRYAWLDPRVHWKRLDINNLHEMKTGTPRDWYGSFPLTIPPNLILSSSDDISDSMTPWYQGVGAFVLLSYHLASNQFLPT